MLDDVRGHGRFYPIGIKITQPRVARNELPWVYDQKITNPERVESIPHIPFIKFNFIALQQLPKLILKRHPLMMVFLPEDITPD